MLKFKVFTLEYLFYTLPSLLNVLAQRNKLLFYPKDFGPLIKGILTYSARIRVTALLLVYIYLNQLPFNANPRVITAKIITNLPINRITICLLKVICCFPLGLVFIISLRLNLIKAFLSMLLFQRPTLPSPTAPQMTFQRLFSLLKEELLSLNAILKTLFGISQLLLPTNAYQVLSRRKQFTPNIIFPLVQLLYFSFLTFLQKPYIRFLNTAFI